MSTRSGRGPAVRIGWRSAALGSLVVAWAAGLGVFALYKSKVTAAPAVVAAVPPAVELAPPPTPVAAAPAAPAPVPPELTVVIPVPVVPPPKPADRPFWVTNDSPVAADPGACDTFGTAVAFERSPAAALARAGREDKLAMVVHLSGHLEDDGFT